VDLISAVSQDGLRSSACKLDTLSCKAKNGRARRDRL